MHPNQAADFLRGHLPGFLWEPLRKAGNAVLGPLHFSFETGHFRSALKSRSVDRKGRPLPWFTIPAVDFIDSAHIDNRSVLEFGAGQSTLYWIGKCSKVVSVETDREWFDRYSFFVHSPHMLIFLETSNAADTVRALAPYGKFDIVVIDGANRYLSCEAALYYLADDGVIIYDNSDGNHAYTPGYGINDLLRERGFSRVDFYGFPLGNSIQQCTSIYFKSQSLWLFDAIAAPQPPRAFWTYRDVIPQKKKDEHEKQDRPQRSQGS